MPTGLEPEINMGKAVMTKWNSVQQMNTIPCQTYSRTAKHPKARTDMLE